MSHAICRVDGCVRPIRSRSLCEPHYRRLLRTGSALGVGKGRPRGESATYMAVHLRLRKDLGVARDHQCADCDRAATGWSYSHSDENELVDELGRPYSLDQAHYQPRCSSCHSKLDKQMRRAA